MAILGIFCAVPLWQYYVYRFDRSLLLFFAPIVVSIPALFALVLSRNPATALPAAGEKTSSFLKGLSILFAGVVAAFLIPAVDGSILVMRGFFIDLFCLAII